MMEPVILTTTNSIEGRSILKYHGIVSARKLIRDLVWIKETENSRTQYNDELRQAERMLKDNALAVSANAVIGIKAYVDQGVLSLTGTAVTIG